MLKSTQVLVLNTPNSLNQEFKKLFDELGYKYVILSDTNYKNTLSKFTPNVCIYFLQDGSTKEIDFYYEFKHQLQIPFLFALNSSKDIDEIYEKLSKADGTLYFPTSSLQLKDSIERAKKYAKLQYRFSSLYHEAFKIHYNIDAHFKITSISEYASKYLGYSKNELLGKDILSFVHHDDHDYVKEEYSKVISKSQELNIEFRKVNKEGQVVWFAENIQQTIDDQDQKGLLISSLDITEQKQIYNQLKLNEERLLLAIESANQGIWDKQLKKNELIVTPSFNRIFDYAEDYKMSTEHYWTNVIHPEDRAHVKDTVDDCIDQNKGHYRAEYRAIKKDNSLIWIEEQGKVVEKSKKGKPTRITGVIRDVSAKKTYEKGLERSKELAEEANRVKSEFLASMSHEIRTPMNTIIGMLSLVLESQLTEEQEDYLNLVNSASSHLLSIINDILDLSKIEAGKIEFQNKEFNVRNTIKEVIDSFKNQADKKDVSINYSIDQDIPLKLLGDSGHIKQILYNLVGNAIKFTHQGSCHLFVKNKGIIDDEKINLGFEVVDTGIGISEDKIDTLFESFSQAHSSTKRHYEGTGLGLVITKNLIEKMGGEIKVESKENKGSKFSFSLCLDLSEHSKQDSNKQSKLNLNFPVAEEDSLNILIAEDNKLNQKLITRLVQNKGHKFTLTENGLEAVQAMRTDHFDLILMDIQMPEMDGIEATVSIRNDISGDFDSNIPIVAVTAYAFAEDRERCEMAGMNDFIPKPINNAKLDAVLNKVMKDKKEAI